MSLRALLILHNNFFIFLLTSLKKINKNSPSLLEKFKKYHHNQIHQIDLFVYNKVSTISHAFMREFLIQILKCFTLKVSKFEIVSRNIILLFI